MAIEYISSALKAQGLSSSQKFVLVALSNRSNQDGECWPSLKDISFQTALSKRSVINSIDYLVSIGALEKLSRYKEGAQTSNLYIIKIDVVNRMHPPSEPYSPPPVNHVHPPSEPRAPKPSIEPSSESSSNNFPLEFEMFWSTYPSHRRESRNKAFPAWEKVISEGRATPEQLQASAEAYRASDDATKDGGRYAKGLNAWLNGDRFLWDYTKKGGNDDKSTNGTGNKKSALDSLAAGFANAPPAKPVEGW